MDLAKGWAVRRLYRRLGLVTSQQQLNALYQYPDMKMYDRFPAVLNTVFVTMFYSGGIPLLLPLACVSIATTFWLDKVMLLRFYRRPYYDQVARPGPA